MRNAAMVAVLPLYGRTDTIDDEGVVDFGLNIPLTGLDPDLAPALAAIADHVVASRGDDERDAHPGIRPRSGR